MIKSLKDKINLIQMEIHRIKYNFGLQIISEHTLRFCLTSAHEQVGLGITF